MLNCLFTLLLLFPFHYCTTPEQILADNDYIYQAIGYYINKDSGEYACYPYEVILDHSHTFQNILSGSVSKSLLDAKKEAEKHIDEFFVDECRSHGLAKRDLGIGFAIGFTVVVVVPLIVSGILLLLELDKNGNEIKKLKEKIRFVEYQTGLFNDTTTNQLFDLREAIDTLVQEHRDVTVAQEILRILDEEKNHIRLLTRGDFNFLLFNRPEINETVLTHLNENQFKWLNESDTLKFILSTAKTTVKCELGGKVVGSTCLISPTNETRICKIFEVAHKGWFSPDLSYYYTYTQHKMVAYCYDSHEFFTIYLSGCEVKTNIFHCGTFLGKACIPKMPSQPCIIQKTETKNNFVFKQRVGDIFIVANTAGIMYSWKNVTRKEKRETNNLPTAKNYRQRNHISTNDLKKLDLNYERTTVHIPHVVVIQPKQEDILAIGPELIDGSKVRSEAKETMRMSQDTLGILEQAKHHVAEIEHVFDARKTAFDSSVAREKQIEEEKIKQISEDGCGILCDIKKAINGYVLIVLVLIKLILIVLVCFAAYKFYVCCKGQYRRV